MKKTKAEFWSTTGVAIIIFIGAAVLLISSLIWRNVKMNSLDDYSMTVDYDNGESIEYTLDDIEEFENPSIEDMETEQSLDDEWDEMVRESATGVSTARKESDDALMDEMFRTALTWEDKETYNEARNEILEDYNIEEDSQFMQDYLPPEESYYLYDGSGALISDDWPDDANIKFVSLESHVSNVSEDDTYSYVTQIMVQSSGSIGGTATGNILAEYDVTSDGEIKNLKAYSVFS